MDLELQIGISHRRAGGVGESAECSQNVACIRSQSRSVFSFPQPLHDEVTTATLNEIINFTYLSVSVIEKVFSSF